MNLMLINCQLYWINRETRQDVFFFYCRSQSVCHSSIPEYLSATIKSGNAQQKIGKITHSQEMRSSCKNENVLISVDMVAVEDMTWIFLQSQTLRLNNDKIIIIVVFAVGVGNEGNRLDRLTHSRFAFNDNYIIYYCANEPSAHCEQTNIVQSFRAQFLSILWIYNNNTKYLLSKNVHSLDGYCFWTWLTIVYETSLIIVIIIAISNGLMGKMGNELASPIVRSAFVVAIY